MKVIDIQKYREFYTRIVREYEDPKRNPNFAGTIRKIGDNSKKATREFGYFDICHSDKPSMENFLKGVLEMASDSQAVYEFLQNAVDEESTSFVMFPYIDADAPNELYLVVINDGNKFTCEGVRAILNIGASTKFGDVNTIGQFGIGFKLAHRLVGAENGLRELLDDNKGPILFSWDNFQFKELENLEYNEIQQEDPNFIFENNKISCNPNTPWLFKILYTNFPCLKESFIDANEVIIENIFTQKEALILKKVAKKVSEELNNSESGTLLLIPLHQSKKDEITNELNRSGIEFSGAILNNRSSHKKLDKIKLNEKEIVKANPIFEPLHRIKITDNAGKKIPENKEDNNNWAKYIGADDIEYYKGFKEIEIDLYFDDPFTNDISPFKSKPQFYVYFPLSNETHNFRFIIHCNAFSFSSSRTDLKENTNRNKLIFKILAEQVRTRLIEYSSTNKKRFEQLYASLLLSTPGEQGMWKENKKWLQDDFWEPLMDAILDLVPIKTEDKWKLAEKNEKVFIKNSQLPFEDWQPQRSWFYWNYKDNFDLCIEASSHLKLKLPVVSIVTLLSDISEVTKINEWLLSPSSKTQNLINEIESDFNLFSGKTDKEKNKFWANFENLKLWTFAKEKLSINELINNNLYDNYYIKTQLFEKLQPFCKDFEILISDENLNSIKYVENESTYSFSYSVKNRFKNTLPYLLNYDEIISCLSSIFTTNSDKIEKNNKKDIYNVIYKELSSFEKTDDRRKKFIKLALFSNLRGEIKPLENLISEKFGVIPEIIKNWKIDSKEIEGIDNELFLTDNEIAIYENIIVNSWKDIAEKLLKPSDRNQLFDFINKVYLKNNTISIIDQELIRFSEDGIAIPSQAFLYHACLTNIDMSNYGYLDSAISKVKAGILPQFTLIKYYGVKPFAQNNISALTLYLGDDQQTGIELSKEETTVLIQFGMTINPNTFSEILFSQNDNGKINVKKNNGKCQFYCENENILIYIKLHHSDKLELIPSHVVKTQLSNILKDNELIIYLIKNLNVENESDCNELIDIIIPKGDELIYQLILKINKQIDINTDLTTNDFLCNLLKICFSIKDNNLLLKSIDTIIHINGQKFSQIHDKGIDTINVNGFDFKISEILPGTNNINHILETAANNWSSLKIADTEIIKNAFGLTETQDAMQVFRDLKNQLTNNVIINCEQLAFVLKMAETNHNLLTDFNIQTRTQIKPLKGNTFYIQDSSFLSNDILLADYFSEIGNRNGLFPYVNQSTIIKHSPSIDNGNLNIPGVKSIENNQHFVFLTYLFDLWKINRPAQITWIENKNTFLSILGKEPKELVLEDALALEIEYPIDWIEQFHNDPEFIEFLIALGANGRDSILCNYRQYFRNESKNESNIPQCPPDPIHKGNTLHWLCIEDFVVTNYEISELYKNLNATSFFPAYSNSDGQLKIYSNGDNFYFLEPKFEEQFKVKNVLATSIAQHLSRPLLCILESIKLYAEPIKKLCSQNDNWKSLPFVLKKIDNIKLSTSSTVWDANFYQIWLTQNNNLIIYKYPGDMPQTIVVEDKIICTYSEDDFYLNDINGEQKALYINGTKDNENVFIILKGILSNEQYNSLYEQYHQEIKEAHQFHEKIKNADDIFRREFEESLRKAEIRQERKESADRLNNDSLNNKYTYQWFCDLMELVRKQENATRIPDIIFSNCFLLDVESQIWELSNSNTKIPSNIEEYDSLGVEITYQDKFGENKSFNTRLEASKKYQTLWVKFNGNESQRILTENKILSVRVTFTTEINLLERLKREFSNIGLMPDYDLKANLPVSLKFLFGPPGTGKTTKIAEQIIDRANEGILGPVIVLTPTNKAADVLTEKIIELNNNICPKWLIRFGTCNNSSLLKYGAVRNSNDFIVDNRSSNVLITTIHRFPYSEVYVDSNNKERLCNCPWVKVIFDESSMIPLVYIAYVIHKRIRLNPDTEFQISGDPFQIPPVFDLISDELEDAEELQLENIYSMVGLNSFNEDDLENFPFHVDPLIEQHRSVFPIGELFNKFQYDNRIIHTRETGKNIKKAKKSRQLPDYFSKTLNFKPITIIRYPVKSGETIISVKKLNDSPFHLFSTLLISELIKRFEIEIDTPSNLWSIGVLSPYREQANLLKKMIDEHKLDYKKLKISTDTVHGFQGDENQMVFVLLNPGSNNVYYSRFLNKKFILNVAISRAEDYLILFVPDDKADGINDLTLIKGNENSLLNIIKSLPQEYWVELQASTIEQILMGQKNYFQMNTFTASHQNVNIYGDPNIAFNIRLGKNAVDVQLSAKK